jgi:hypothetical protein
VHNTGKEGFYVGSTAYDTGVVLGCQNGSQTVLEPVLKGVNIYENIVEQTGWDGIQVGSTTENCEIHHNRLYQDSQANSPGQRSGIGSSASVCHIYNNFIKESSSKSIRSDVYGDIKIYNNVIINPGTKDYSGDSDGISIMASGYGGKNVYIWHNTIINSLSNGINFAFIGDSNSLIQNNIIINPGSYSSLGEQAYIWTEGYSNVTLSHNFTSLDIGAAQFASPGTDDYSLLTGSPAIDSGVDLSGYGIIVDYLDISRPQGPDYDIGAYESD